MKLKGKAKAAFLRRMARGRNKKHTKHRKHRKHTRRSHVAKRRRHHSKKTTRRRHHSGAMGKYIPPTDKLIGMGAAFAYGKAEAAASKDQNHFVNKVPSIIAQLGRAGNLGALLWLGGVVTRHPIVKSVASGVLHVAAYQNGRGGGFTKDAQDFKLSGPFSKLRDAKLVENYLRTRHQHGG